MLGAIAATLGLGVAAVTIRPFQRLLKTTPLGGSDWGLVAAGAMLPVLIRGQALQKQQSPGEPRPK